MSEFASQLREKQKLRSLYHLREQQFKRYVHAAMQVRGKDAGEKLMEFLERRLDNVVERAGFVGSLGTARQLVSHGHVLVNGKRVKTASYEVQPRDIITLSPKMRTSGLFKDADLTLKNYTPPAWVSLDKEKWEATITGIPAGNETMPLHNTKLIIEYYAR